MSRGPIVMAKAPSPLGRALGILAFSLLGLGLLAAAAYLPFRFVSQSLWYKLGLDRVLLRSGQVVGMLAATLLVGQTALAARLRPLDRVFGLSAVYRLHRLNGLAIAVLALLHPLLVFGPEEIRALPVAAKYWPQLLGTLLMVTICLQAGIARQRSFLDLDFRRWRPLHGAVALVALVMLALHLRYVTEVFTAGTGRRLHSLGLGLGLGFLAWGQAKRRLVGGRPFIVRAVSDLSAGITRLELQPSASRPFAFLPGQFVFLTCQSPSLPREEHPFTIASAPSRAQGLVLAIRASGDWTSRIHTLTPGSSVTVDGPYGRFSHQLYPLAAGIIMVAGGIGITPMLSMLQTMADQGADHDVTLIWSNRQAGDLVFADSLAEFGRRLAGLTVIHHLSREGDGRLTEARLRDYLAGRARAATVFLCGPPAMIHDVKDMLLRLGFSRRRIVSEEFSL